MCPGIYSTLATYNFYRLPGIPRELVADILGKQTPQNWFLQWPKPFGEQKLPKLQLKGKTWNLYLQKGQKSYEVLSYWPAVV